MKVAAYCRVSTDQEDQTNSLESQKRFFQGYIENNPGWELVKIYADKGISGTQATKRPAFMQMIQEAQNKGIDLILTKEISRFARNTIDSLRYTRELKALGVGVIFINDNINTLDPDAELRLTIMSSIAQEEVRKTSQRVKWGQKRRMEQGVVFGNGVYGYYLHNGRLRINEEEAEVVRLIYQKYVFEGKGTHTIARELREAGHQTKRKSEWSNTNILNILRNEKYAGDLLQKKEYTPDYLSHKKVANHGSEPKVFLQNHHQPIVGRDLWNKAQEELKRRAPTPKDRTKYSNRYWCSGKIKCGLCGARYIQKTNKRNYGLYRVWVCRNATPRAAGQAGCGNTGVNYKTLMHCMGFAVDLLLENKQAVAQNLENDLRGLVQSMWDTGAAELLKKQSAARAKKEKLLDLYVNGILSMEELRSARARYEREIQSCEAQLHDCGDAQSARNNQLEKTARAFQKIYESEPGDPLITEEVYKVLLNNIYVHPHHIDIQLQHIPTTIRLTYLTQGAKNSFKTIITGYETV